MDDIHEKKTKKGKLSNKTKAAVFMIAASFFYAGIAALVKWVEDIPVFERLFFRNGFGLIFITVILFKNKQPFWGGNKGGLFARGVTGFIGAALYYYGIANIPLADSATLSNLYPVFVVIFSAVFLKEAIRKSHIGALAFSLLGVMLVIRPGFSETSIFYIAAFLSSVVIGMTDTIIRHLRKTEAGETVVFYYSFWGTLFCVPFMMAGNFIIPSATDFMWLLLLGAVGTVYQICLTASYRYGEAGKTSIYSYTTIIFSTVFGMMFWSEYPHVATIGGMACILYGAWVIYKKG